MKAFCSEDERAHDERGQPRIDTDGRDGRSRSGRSATGPWLAGCGGKGKRAKPEREKLFGFVPWSRPSSAVGYSQALKETWADYKDETGNTRANRKNFNDSADFIGWYASKGYYQGFDQTDARSLYLAYHEGYGGFKKKSYRQKQWLINVADRVQARSTKYQKQYWGCAEELKKKRFLFF